jgi:hypothetical protein
MMAGFGRSGQMVCPLSRVWAVLLAFAVLLTAGCSRQEDQQQPITIDHEISPSPAHAGPAVITLRLTDGAGKPVTGAHIAVESDMTHAGMAPAFGEAKEIEAGRYQTNLTFQMAGDWVILLHITLANGQKLERQFDVPGVQPN